MVEYHYNKDTLSAFIDREIPEDEAKIINRHLQSCPRCNKVVRNLTLLSDTLKQLPRPAADPYLAVNISKQLQAAGKMYTLPLTRLFTTWGILNLAAVGMFLLMPGGTVFLRLLSNIYNETAVLLTSLLHFSWNISSGPVNLMLGLVFMIGALLAFYEFGRVYFAADKKELLS